MKFTFRNPIIVLLINMGLFFSSRPAFCDFPAVKENVTHKELPVMISEAKKLYDAKFSSGAGQVQELFGMDVLEYKQSYPAQIEQLNAKIALIETIGDAQQKQRARRQLEQEYGESKLFKYLEAQAYLQNEIAKDHAFIGEYLAGLEEIVALLIRQDPFLRHVFLSRQLQQERGLILTRVVWEINVFRPVPMETQPLLLHSVFADKAKTPVLIRITPAAFVSPAYLRSLLIHELNHVYMLRDSFFSDPKKFQGAALAPAQGAFTHYFKFLNPAGPSYQYYLIHEYYSLNAQLMFDKLAGSTPFLQLDDKNRQNIEQILGWVYSQLNEENKKVVRVKTVPPIFSLAQQFWGSRVVNNEP